MSIRPFTVAVPAAVFAASAGLAQNVMVGNLPPNPNFGFQPTPITVTAIDLSNPATTTATLTSAAFTWQAAPCPATVKIKFFRPAPTGTLVFLAERGPYDVVSNTQFLFLSPPVSVQAGDLIGIGRVAACGSPVGQAPGAAAGFVAFGADVTTSVNIGQGTTFLNATVSVQASGTVDTPPPGPDPAAVLPVVGSTPGAIGQAFFRTTVQIHNPRAARISGRVVYHPQGTPASPSNPALPYVLESGETRSIPDLLAAMGLFGLGSADVVPDGADLPLVTARVYNDAGAAGTTGFTEESVKPEDALAAGERGILVAPFDTALYRFNVGVRTLGGGATLAITVRNAGGGSVATLTRTYPANYFEQRESSAFLDGAILGASYTISVQVVAGSAVVYGATVDNRTNDPSMQLARTAP